MEKREWELNLYGRGRHESYLRKLVEHYQLGSFVKFNGYASNIEAIWRQHHILILPSIVEGNSIALMEALSYGRCALVTSTGSGSEWIEDEINGFVVDGFYPSTLRKGLEKVWGARKNLKVLGMKAYETFRKKYQSNSGEKIVEQLINFNGENGPQGLTL